MEGPLEVSHARSLRVLLPSWPRDRSKNQKAHLVRSQCVRSVPARERVKDLGRDVANLLLNWWQRIVEPVRPGVRLGESAARKPAHLSAPRSESGGQNVRTPDRGGTLSRLTGRGCLFVSRFAKQRDILGERSRVVTEDDREQGALTGTCPSDRRTGGPRGSNHRPYRRESVCTCLLKGGARDRQIRPRKGTSAAHRCDLRGATARLP